MIHYDIFMWKQSDYYNSQTKTGGKDYNGLKYVKTLLWSFITPSSSLLFPALHMACIGQHADAARTLLQLGVKDSEDASGKTARQLAKKPDVVRVFECDLPDSSLITPQ